MRAFRWIVITLAVVAGLLLVAIAVGAVWLKSLIHSPAFLSEVEARAGQSLGGTVRIKNIDFDIFHGVKLEGLAAQIDLSSGGGKGTLAAHVATVNCACAWPELLHRRLKLTGVTLDQPQIVLSRSSVGPQPATGPMPSSNAAPSAENSAEPSGPVPNAGASAAAFQFVLDRVQVHNGTFSLTDANGRTAAGLQGVDISVDTSDYLAGQSLSGTLKVAAAVLAPGLTVTHFSTPVSYRPGALSAKPLSASVFDGNLAGGYDFLLFSGPSLLELNGNGLNVAKLLAVLSPGSSTAALTGSLDLQSKWRAIEQGAVDGEGDLQLTNGQLHGVQILNDIGSLLKINELNDPLISQGRTHFQMANQQTQLTGLELVFTGGKITGGGIVAWNGGLNLSLVLTLSKDAMGRLPQPMAASFVAQTDGTGTIGFNVTGSTSNPQTDLPQRLLTQNTQIKNAINKALNKFFH